MSKPSPSRSTLRDLPGYLRVFETYIGRRMYVVFTLVLVASIAEGFGIVMLVPLLQSLDAGGGGEASSWTVSIVSDVLGAFGARSVAAMLGVIGLMFLLKGLVTFLSEGYTGYLQARLMRELRSQLFDAYSHMDYRYYVSRDTGHFINVINAQISNFYVSFRAFVQLLASIIMTASYCGFAMLVAWRFGLMALVTGILLLLLFRRLNLFVRELSRNTSAESGHLSKLLIQALHAFKYLTATRQAAHLRDAIVGSIRRLAGYQVRQEIANAFTHAIREPLSVLFIIGIVIIQITVLKQPLAPIMVAILLFHRGLNAVMGIQSNWQYTLIYIGSVEMVRDEFGAQAAHRERDGTREIGPLAQGIEFRKVSFSYQSGVERVLQDVSLTINALTTVAIVGESGAGKSTISDMLSLMLKPTAGQVLIDGVPGDEIRLASWRRQIGYVSQETVVFDDSLANNICLWEGDVSTDAALFARVREAARKAYIDHFIESLPDGYQTQVGDRGVRLSGGQRQRLFIARELFKRPYLLILDEATSALDSESESYVRQSIDALHREMTVVIIAHRLSTIRNVDEVYVFDSGRLLEHGPYEVLREQKASRFQAMIARQTL